MTRRLYTLEARDKVGVFLGMSVADCALIGGGLALAVALHLGGAPLAIAATPPLVGAALAKLQAGGRPLREWVPLLGGWAAARFTGRRSWLVPLPLLPTTAAAGMPPMLRGIDIVEIPAGTRHLAAVRDQRTNQLTAVVRVRGTQFACQDDPAQAQLIGSWGDVLGSTAATGSPVVQIGWSDAATLSVMAEHRAWATERLGEVDGTAGDPASYRDLLEDVAGLAASHDTLVWFTVAGARVHDTKGKPLARAAEHLPIALDNLLAAVRGAGLTATDPLTASELRSLLRARIDPADDLGRPRPSHGTLAERLGMVEAHAAGPLAASTAWSQLRLDGSFHRTWWIESWPRRPVPGDWLQSFLARGESRVMTVLHHPVDPERSQRRIESQMVKLTANRHRKIERDRRVTETDLRTEQAVHDLEAELAAGYAEVLYLGLVTVSAPTTDELDSAARRTEQAARAHGLGLRVLHGRQDLAWAATLPFALTGPGLLEVVGV